MYEEALTYARKMVHDYSAKSKSWAFFCRVNFLINSDYDASEILKIIYKCPDYQYNNNSDESFADNIRDFVHRTFIRKETKKADRKKKFKIISIVVLSVILFVGISIFLFFSINYYVTTVKPNINGINYSLDDDGYILTKYDVTDAEEIVIPNEINGKRIIDVAEGAFDEDDVLRFCAVADLAVGVSSGGDGVRSIRDLVADTLAGLTDADELAARDDDPVLIDDSDDAIHRVLHLVDNSLK